MSRAFPVSKQTFYMGFRNIFLFFSVQSNSSSLSNQSKKPLIIITNRESLCLPYLFLVYLFHSNFILDVSLYPQQVINLDQDLSFKEFKKQWIVDCEVLENSWFNQVASHLYCISVHARQGPHLDYHPSDRFNSFLGASLLLSSL